MYETPDELSQLQQLLDDSFAKSSPHLLSIMEAPRRLSAGRLTSEIPSPAVLNIATVTAKGEPRVSAVDGHFLHGRWHFTTASECPKERHLAQRPGISASYTPRDGYGVFCHGTAMFLDGEEKRTVLGHVASVYGTDVDDWADYPCVRIEPHWMTGFAMTDDEMAQIEADKAARASD